MGEKARNCFYVIADSKVEKGREYFSYQSLLMLSGFSFEKFLSHALSGASFRLISTPAPIIITAPSFVLGRASGKSCTPKSGSYSNPKTTEAKTS
jgi:hypothetical protein